MPALTTDQCYAHASRFDERVVLITGAGSGFGRATAVEFAKHGALLVLGDINEEALVETAAAVQTVSGFGVSVHARCDVTKWEDQVKLFELGIKAYGRIDIVLPNAGVTEVGSFDPRKEADPTKLTPPNLVTLDIDLTGVLYTTRIALFHWTNDKRPASEIGLRAIVFTGSMSTFYGSHGVMYGAAKAAILGIQKGIEAVCKDIGVRVGTVCPYFSKTNILTADFVHPNPKLGYAAVEDVVAAFVTAITDPNEKTNFGCYLIPDKHGVWRMDATGQFIGADSARRMKPKAAKL